MSWRPIETAPKDMGSYLFLCNRVIVQGFRDATGKLNVCIEAGASGNPPWRLMRRAPTHWMPRPADPESHPQPAAIDAQGDQTTDTKEQ